MREASEMCCEGDEIEEVVRLWGGEGFVEKARAMRLENEGRGGDSSVMLLSQCLLCVVGGGEVR